MKKNVWKRVIAAGMAAAMTVGCGTVAFASEEKPYEGESLRIMMSSGDFGPDTIKSALNKAGEIMGIEIEYDVIPDDQMLNVANTNLATGNAADVIIHNFGLTDVSAKDLAPLEGDWAEKITSTTKPLCVDVEGNVLKAPLGGESNMGLLYNKKVLEECGIEMPIANYDAFIAACETLKEKGYTPLYISNKEVWTAQILLLTTMTTVFENDITLAEKLTANELKPSEIPELVELWENAVSLRDLGYVNEDYMSATNDMAFEALVNGECAFYAQMDSAYGTLAESYPDQVGDIGMTYTPLWKDEANAYAVFGTATNYLSASAASEKLDVAKAFIDTVLSEEVLTLYYELVPGSAPYKDLGFELSMNPFNEEMRGYGESVAVYGDFQNNTYGEHGKILEAYYGAFNEQIQGLFSGKSVEESLDSWYNAYAADAKARRVEGF